MSGIAKGIKKVFKKVGKVVKKIAPFALPIAAAVFTVGGALGIPAMAGGWGGAVGKLFGGSALGKVLGGAVTQAGYFGLGGMAIGAATGDMRKGALFGQAAGAVFGGVSGAMSAAGPGAASSASQASMPAGGAAPGMGAQGAIPGTAPGISPSQAALRASGATAAGGAAPGMAMSAAAPQVAGAAQTGSAMGITQAAQQLPSAGMVTGGGAAPGFGAAAGQGGGWWANQDPIVQASMISGGFASLGPAMQALNRDKEDENQQLQVEDARRKAIADNYRGFSNPPPPSLVTRPAQRYVYDPAQGRVVLQYS